MPGSGLHFKRILWAVEFFGEQSNSPLPSLFALKALTRAFDCEVEPVCLIEASEVPSDVAPLSERLTALRFTANSRQRDWMSQVYLPGLATPKLILHRGHSLRSAARAIGDYALGSQADLIVVTTHARHGWDRLLHGSFTEALLHSSPVPALICNPVTRVGWKFESILFPSDLTPRSRAFYLDAVDLAAQMKVRIDLYHEVEDLFPLLTPVDFMSPVAQPYGDVKELMAHAERTVATWRDLARNQGVAVDYEIRTRRGDLARAISARAQAQESGLICMASGSSALTAYLSGSITQQVIRHAILPVLVLHRPQHPIEETALHAA